MLNCEVVSVQSGQTHTVGARPRKNANRQGKQSVRRYGREHRCRGPSGQIEDGVGLTGGVVVLHRQHRQVLSYRVAKDGAKDANIITASIAQANDGLGGNLISDPQTRPKIFPVSFDVKVATDSSHACGTEKARIQIQETSVSVAVYILWINDVPTQTVGDGQL